MRAFVYLLTVIVSVPALAGGLASGETRNRLAEEPSPYLRQHAVDPVDWHPWGEEAFVEARRENKLIYLSIGYSACHWCHVMQEEVFSRADVARLLNERFVPVLVDREERPDVDAFYMTFLQATTGSGGWPANIILTPDLQPFFGGTFFPAQDESGRPGLLTILGKLSLDWETRGSAITATSNAIMSALAKRNESLASSQSALDPALIDQATLILASRFDTANGGFGRAPKFPQPLTLSFLLHRARRGDDRALQMASGTLEKMIRGGVHDHVGGGFHRYAVDAGWHVPHFEKMLYDQALISIALVEAFQITGDAELKEAARSTLDFVLDEMRSPDGGFYSSLDADSGVPGKPGARAEGAFYLWTLDEMKRVVGPRHAEIVSFCFGVTPKGNVPDELDPRGELRGKSILIVRRTIAETARRFDTSREEISAILDESLGKMRDARAKRPAPRTDTKILASWNGLMISAFARAGQALGEEKYTRAATDAASFVESRLWDAKLGKLRRRFADGHAGIDGVADDYSFMIAALLDLYETTFDVRWLQLSRSIQEAQDRTFWSEDRSGYRRSIAKSEIPADLRDSYEHDMPSHDSVSVVNLLRLAAMTGQEAWAKRARTILSSYSGVIGPDPTSMPALLTAFDLSVSSWREVVIAGPAGNEKTKRLLGEVHRRFIPAKILLLADGSTGQKQLVEWLPFVGDMRPIDGAATAYVCENRVCNLPTSDPSKLAALLDALR